MQAEPIDPEALYGVWRLTASRATDAAGRVLADPWGPQPMGSLVLARNGRMMAVLCDGRTDLPAGHERAYSSYCGRFVVLGDRLTTTVDAASDPARTGSLQVRELAFVNGLLVLRPPRRPDGAQRELFWLRVGDSG